MHGNRIVNRFVVVGLRQFGDADSGTLVRRRDVLAMVVANVLYEKKCVLQWLDYKGCLFDKCFCCHSESQGPVWFTFHRKFRKA